MIGKKAQYTIRGVLPEVDSAIRRNAEERHLSLNAYLVEELGRIAEQATESGLHHDLDFVIGSMADGALVDEALVDFARVDDEHWR